MAKVSKPESDTKVLEVMKSYCKYKEYTFSDTQLDYMSQSCYLYFESKGWKGISYWPAVAKRWVLNNLDRQYKGTYKLKAYKGKSVKDEIMEQENNDKYGV